MTVASTTRNVPRTTRRSRANRRGGYIISALLNAAGLYIINIWPGWDAVPFLTADTRQVLGIVNTVLIATLAANVLYVFRDPRWLVALGSLATTLLGLIGLIRIWKLFPFDFGPSSNWPLVFHIGLAVGIIGSCIAILVQLIQLSIALARRR